MEQVSRIKALMSEIAKELAALEPRYIGGEEWDPEKGYTFTAESTSPLRGQLSESGMPSDAEDSSRPHQKDLSECIRASRIHHQTEWVLKMSMPEGDSHVMMCISFCDGAIPEPPNPYNDPPRIRLDI